MRSGADRTAPGARKWTWRTVVPRARGVVATEGPQSLLVKILGDTVYRRLWLYEATEPPRRVEAAIPVQLSGLLSADVEKYAAAQPAHSAHEAATRLEEGASCLLARHEGRIVGSIWVTPDFARIDYLDLTVPLESNERYLHEVYVDPAVRNRLVGVVLLTAMVRDALRDGAPRVIGTGLPENAAGIRLIERGGLRRVGTVGYVGVGRWRRHFLRLQ